MQASTGSERNTQRLLRQAPAEQPESAKTADAKEEDRPWYVSLGISRESAGAGHTVSTPYLISWTSDPWYLEVSGDGYLDAAGDATRLRGLADVALVLAYAYKFGKGYALTPEVELDLPSHGAVGSTRSSQALGLTLERRLGAWGWAARIGAARAGDAEPDVSRYTKAVSLKLHHDLRADTITSLKLARSLQAGAPAGNRLTWDLEFPLPTPFDNAGKGRKVWSAIITLARERSAGSSSHSIGFDIACAF